MSKKYCLITGAAGGFGRAYTHKCIEDGYTPILTDINIEYLEKIKKALYDQYQTEVVIIASDIRNDHGMDGLWQYLDINSIKLSLVINTVGLEIEGVFVDLDPEQVTNIVKTNVVGFTNVISHSLLYKDAHLDIINFASLAGFFSMPFKAVYAASKSYIINLSRALHLELKKKDVNVLVVCPGGVPTRQEVIDRIKRQGFYGKLTTSKVEDIVGKSIKLVKKGKSVFVPKVFNKFLVFISKILPSMLGTKLIARRFMTKK